MTRTGIVLVQERLTHSVIGAFYEVYGTLGFGFLEHLYVLALDRELRARGHRVDREVWVNVRYKGELLGKQRLDMVVDDTLVVEAKASFDLPHGAGHQVYNYLRATNLEVGLLLHFGPRPRIKRFIYMNHQFEARGQDVTTASSVQSASSCASCDLDADDATT